MKRCLCSQERSRSEEGVLTVARTKSTLTAFVLWYTQDNGIKPTSGASPRAKVARLSDGEGEARRKAGLMECSESLLLRLLKGGQGPATGWGLS